MCTHKSLQFHILSSSKRIKCRSKHSRLQIYRLTCRRRSSNEVKEDKRDILQLQNLKLYLDNQIIIEENEKLRKKASLLHQENIDLMSQLQNKFLNLDRYSTTLLILQHV